MKKIVTTFTSCLLFTTAYSQVPFVTYEAVPQPDISIPRIEPFRINAYSIPNVKVVSSDIITANALCIPTEGESFTLGTKIMIRKLSNGMTTLGLIGIKQGKQWNSLDEITLISISNAISQAESKEEKDTWLSMSDFSYLAILGKDCMLLFK